MQFGYPHPIRLSFFRNPVRSGYGSELQNPVGSRSGNRILFNTGEHGQYQDWLSCRILAIFLNQDWIWIFIFEKIGSAQDHNICLISIMKIVIQDVTNDGGSVFFAIVFIITKKIKMILSVCTHHNQLVLLNRYFFLSKWKYSRICLIRHLKEIRKERRIR